MELPSLSDLARRVRPWLARPVLAWRRSIQFRVVTSVLVLSAVVTGIIGLQLLNQITDGLVRAAARSAVAEAKTENAVAEERLRQAGASDFDPAAQLRQLVDSMVDRGKVRGFEVV
ncbi:MAG TPA: two-component sensor histidine kinase, partial [Marmoricola sp.]|nr:two-component sensor histidine kinase [Marmoricola sp.]